ncbi:hypothetical protein AWV80_09575 [Cupriavidus sp. UYMU48A]|nr:hypothetical protein AWV80_09575 [Cupriavidus sp. UYMU48A]
MVNTYSRFILASNERKPLDFEETERRWYPVTWMEHEVDADETQRFIARLADWLDEPESMCKVYNYFMTYPLAGFNYKRVPPSKTLRDMVAMSKTLHEQHLASFLEDHKVFTTEQVQGYFVDQKLGLLPTKDLPNVMSNVKYENTQREYIKGEKKFHLWHPVGMSLADARTEYAKPVDF